MSDEKSKTLPWTIAATVVVCIIGIPILLNSDEYRKQLPGIPGAPFGSSNGITLAKFNQIQIGMTYPQVVKILGKQGELTSEMRLGEGTVYDTHSMDYQWEGSGFSSMSATFNNGKLIQKYQFGLR